MCDTVVIGYFGDFNIQVALKGEDRDAGVDKVHAQDADRICQAICIIVSARIASNQQDEHDFGAAALRDHLGGRDGSWSG